MYIFWGVEFSQGSVVTQLEDTICKLLFCQILITLCKLVIRN